MRVLILGGTTEANALCRALAGQDDLAPILSMAGRTLRPTLPAIPHRIGGFGGTDGLADYLRREGISAVVDATHPFAARISAHAATACARLRVPLVAFTRPPWHPQDGDRWTVVPDLDAAAAALGEAPRRVLLTVGRLGLAPFLRAPQHRYLIRTIDPASPAELPPDHAMILARGPFELAGEEALMQRERIDVVVTKNSGGTAAAAKLEAARMLGAAVVLVERPVLQERRQEFLALDEVMGWIETHRGASSLPAGSADGSTP